MKKKIASAASAAVLAIALLGLTPTAAQAHYVTNDPGVTITKTGGITGVYDSGVATVTNYGHADIPAGTTIIFGARSQGSIPEPHVTTVIPHNFTQLAAVKVSISYFGNSLVTLKPLKPGESFTYSWKVLHYGLWHRVDTTASIHKLPRGYVDDNLHNNSVTIGHDGHQH